MVKQVDIVKEEPEQKDKLSKYGQQRASHRSKLIKKSKTGKGYKTPKARRYFEDQCAEKKEEQKVKMINWDKQKGTPSELLALIKE